MLRPSGLLPGLCCALALMAAPGHAQPAPAQPAPAQSAPAQPAPAPAGSGQAAPETLETPYEDAAPPVSAALPQPAAAAPPPAVTAPPAPPAADSAVLIAVPTADTRPLRPIRARRRLALMGELAWNGLAGFGPILTFHVDPHVSTDLGAGFSLLGWKLGGRVRYNFLTTPFTPFVGVGFNYGGGLGQVAVNQSSDANYDPERGPVTVDLGPSYLIQGTLGFDFIHRRGFSMLGTLGWAWLLNHNNYKVLAGELKPEEKLGFAIAFQGGLVLGVATGYAFE